MRRREFLALTGGATAAPSIWPTAARAQQQSMPVIGFLGSQPFDYYEDLFRAFRQGLKESGYVDGENVAIVSRSADVSTSFEAALMPSPDLDRRLVRYP